MLNSSESQRVSSTPARLPANSSAQAVKISPPAMMRRLGMKESFFACAFLSLYVALYLGAGFLSLAAIEWLWTELFA
jgi:hypothetical protein